jgi:hypothetical protein
MGQTRLGYIDGKVQRGRGKCARVLGQTYDVHRLTNSSNGSIIGTVPFIPDFQMYLTPAKKTIVENQKFDLLVFEGECDNRRLQLGDVLVETSYENDEGIWAFAQARPRQESLFVRCETICFISKPNTAAGAASQQPDSGVTVGKAWAGTSRSIEPFLKLVNGLYTFSKTVDAGPASIPCGIQPLNRVRDGTIPKLPTTQYRTHHLIYVPPIKGEQLNEQWRINASASDRYEIMSVHNTDMTGLIGSICIAEKLAN